LPGGKAKPPPAAALSAAGRAVIIYRFGTAPPRPEGSNHMISRLKKRYENIIEELSQDTDIRYRDYLLRKRRTVIHGNLILDLEHLDSFYACDGCSARHPRAFCCRNHELELTTADLETLEAVKPEVFTAFPRLAALAGRRGGLWRYGDNFERVMAQKSGGDCLFLMPGGDGCWLHRFALERGLDPIDVKPYICSLYPVVVIVIDEQVVVTTLNRDSAKILETGDNTHACLAKKGRPEDHVLFRSRDIITRMFGVKTWQAMHDAVFPPA
jgi:hypothetical protein